MFSDHLRVNLFLWHFHSLDNFIFKLLLFFLCRVWHKSQIHNWCLKFSLFFIVRRKYMIIIHNLALFWANLAEVFVNDLARKLVSGKHFVIFTDFWKSITLENAMNLFFLLSSLLLKTDNFLFFNLINSFLSFFFSLLYFFIVWSVSIILLTLLKDLLNLFIVSTQFYIISFK